MDLDVVDDGRGPGPGFTAGSGTGHGLIGMRERVLLYGGSLAAGPGPDGGFAVRMVLPAEDAAGAAGGEGEALPVPGAMP